MGQPLLAWAESQRGPIAGFGLKMFPHDHVERYLIHWNRGERKCEKKSWRGKISDGIKEREPRARDSPLMRFSHCQHENATAKSKMTEAENEELKLLDGHMDEVHKILKKS